MRTIIMYHYLDKETQANRISYDPMPITECRIRYYLTADDNKILINIKTNQKRLGVIVPEWELLDWEEVDM